MAESLLDRLERHPGATMAVIGIVFATLYVGALTAFPRSHGRIIDGDGIQYYAYLRSLVVDRDLDFRNDYDRLYSLEDESRPGDWSIPVPETGRLPNMMPVGPALLWAPAFLLTLLGTALARLMGADLPLDGFALPFQLSVGVAGVAYATGGAYLCYRATRLLFPHRPAFWGTLVAWLATPALYYSLVSPTYSHATSLFAWALFCFVWLSGRGSARLSRALGLGVLAGIAGLVRWQDVVIVLLPLLELAWLVAHRQRTMGRAFAEAGLLVAATGVTLLPQFLAWNVLYGSPFVMPQGAGFMQWTAPALASVLLSLRHGLLTWTPAVIPALIGLAYLVRRDPVLGWAAVALVTLTLYVNASVSDWWAGEAFGARRFISVTVFFALGLGALWSHRVWRPGWMRGTAIVLIAYNVLFLLQYQLFMRGYANLAPYPTTAREVFVDRLIVPWRLLQAWWNG